MDVHRCRFVDWPPSPINALAFSHTTGAVPRGPPVRLAIGRANGNIEIWDPRNGDWLHETTILGGQGRSVEDLAWTTDPDVVDASGTVTYGRLRLFSIGYSDTVTEWDLVSGTPMRQSSGSHSDVWCLAAQPRSHQRRSKKSSEGDLDVAPKAQDPQDIVVGCADGSLVLLSTQDEELTFKKVVARSTKKARALSIAWQNPEIVVAGYSDSTARVYNAVTNQHIRAIALGAGPKGGPREKLVWAVQPLANGNIVTGDSSGEVCWWDGKSYGQLQRLKSHEADVLCLAAGADGKTIVSGGMDRRTCIFKLGDDKRWSRVEQRRVHDHDVKAIASFENPKTSVAVSGGVDAHPIVHPMRESGIEHHRTLPYTPQSPPMTGARRLVVSWWSNQVSIWRVLSRAAANDDEEWGRPSYVLMARLALKTDEHISRAAITAGGDLLAVSTAAETKLFQLRRNKDKLKVKKLEAPSLSKRGAKLLEFSPDSKWLLLVDQFNAIRVFHMLTTPAPQVSASALTLTRTHRPASAQTCLNGSWGTYTRTITRATFSSDSNILAVADLEGYVDSWLLEGRENAADVDAVESSASGDDESSEEDEDENDGALQRQPKARTLLGQTWALNPKSRSLPRLSSPPLILSFIPSSASTTHVYAPDSLFVVTASHTLQIFSLKNGLLHDWSRRNPSHLLPDEFKLQRERASGCIWDTGDGRCRAWLNGGGWISMFDLSQDLPIPHSQQDKLEAPEGQAALTNGTESADREESNAMIRKRKRADSSSKSRRSYVAEELASRKGASGAGSRATGEEVKALNTKGIRILDSEGKGKAVVVSEPEQRRRRKDQDDAMEIDDDDDDVADNALVQLRRGHASNGTTAASGMQDSEEDDMAVDEEAADSKEIAKGHTGSGGRPFFLTSRYRPILGMVALTAASDDEGDEGAMVLANGTGHERQVLEVAIVERPLWEVDLPARFGVDIER